MILDSIQHTLQYNFVDPQQGDPSTLDIYFSMEGKDITLPDGIIVPSTSPYHGIMISDNKEGKIFCFSPKISTAKRLC